MNRHAWIGTWLLLSLGSAIVTDPAGASLISNPTRLKSSQIPPIQTQFSGKEVIANQSFQVKLPACGSCLFIPVVDSTRKLDFYLVKAGKIRYAFPRSEQVKSWSVLELKALSFTELNFDGGDGDLIVIADYTAGPSGPGTSSPFTVVTVYLTEEKGYSIDEKMSRILTDRKVKTIAEALKIMRTEFNFIP